MATSAVAAAARTTWTIDPAHSNLEFSVRHLMIATARGRFSGVTGTVILDEEEPSKSSIDVAIDASTVDTRESQRDTHLRSADFFDVEQYPRITFTSTNVARTSDDRFRVAGNLTIRGVSRPVALDVVAEGHTTDPWGNERAGFSATTKIKRSDFGLTWNQILEAGGVAVGDEVKVTIDAELVEQQPGGSK